MMKDHNMKFYFAQECGEDIYFSSSEYNGLFKKNIYCDYVEYLGYFENENLFQTGLHSRVFKDGNKIFFLPYNGKGISVYDIDTKKKEYIELPSNVHYASYVNAIKIKDLWLLVPQKNQWKFLWLDIAKMRVQVEEELSNIVEEKVGDFCLEIDASFMVNETIYISFLGTPFLGMLDISKKEIILKSFTGYSLANIEKNGDDIWITTLDGNVIRWNENLCKEYVYKLPATKERPYYCVLSWNDRLFLLPFSIDEIYEYDYSSDNWYSLDSVMPLEYKRDVDEGLPLVVGYTKKIDTLELYPRSGNGGLIITDNKVEYRSIKGDSEVSEIVKEYVQIMLSQQLERDAIVFESEQLRLNHYIDLLNSE